MDMKITKPAKLEDEARTEIVAIRMTKQEKANLIESSRIYGLSLSDYMRFVGVNSKIQVIAKDNG